MGNAPAREGQTTLQPPPREDLRRSVPFELVRAEDDEGDGLTLEGYAAVFDTPTRIDSWEGTFDEQISRGAFRRTLRAQTPVLQFDHGRHPLIGSIPLGLINEASEDDRGLFVRARMTDNWLIQPIRDAISDGAVNGMSFRFTVVQDVWRDANGKLVKDEAELAQLLWEPGDRGPLQRTLKEVKVPELGPVVFPAYVETSVGVRSMTIDLERLNDPGQRAALARAVFLVDAADSKNDDPQVTEESPDEHASERDAPQVTEPSPDEHSSISESASTDRLRQQIEEVLSDVRAHNEQLEKRGLVPITKDE